MSCPPSAGAAVAAAATTVDPEEMIFSGVDAFQLGAEKGESPSTVVALGRGKPWGLGQRRWGRYWSTPKSQGSTEAPLGRWRL